jgi:hypothetical protein
MYLLIHNAHEVTSMTQMPVPLGWHASASGTPGSADGTPRVSQSQRDETPHVGRARKKLQAFSMDSGAKAHIRRGRDLVICDGELSRIRPGTGEEPWGGTQKALGWEQCSIHESQTANVKKLACLKHVAYHPVDHEKASNVFIQYAVYEMLVEAYAWLQIICLLVFRVR